LQGGLGPCFPEFGTPRFGQNANVLMIGQIPSILVKKWSIEPCHHRLRTPNSPEDKKQLNLPNTPSSSSDAHLITPDDTEWPISSLQVGIGIASSIDGAA
jgi:hypothetical protein